MNNYDVGREFEREAFEYIKNLNIFKYVIWSSKNKSSTFDFTCANEDGEIYYGDAKVVSDRHKPSLSISQKEADFVVAKMNGKIVFIWRKDFKDKVLIKKSKLVSIYPSDALKKKLEASAKRDGRSLNNFILAILNKYYSGGRK